MSTAAQVSVPTVSQHTGEVAQCLYCARPAVSFRAAGVVWVAVCWEHERDTRAGKGDK